MPQGCEQSAGTPNQFGSIISERSCVLAGAFLL
jgi:hypothetical protein